MPAHRRDDRHAGAGRPTGAERLAGASKSAPQFTSVRLYGTADPLPPETVEEPPPPPPPAILPVAPTAAAVPAPPRPRVRPKPVLPRYEPRPAAPRPAARPAPVRRSAPGTVRRALFEEFPEESPAAISTDLPPWAGFARGVAAWLGVLAAATALAVPAEAAFPTDLWWLDASPFPPEGVRFALSAWGIACVLAALLPTLPAPLRFGGCFGAAVVVGLSLRATAIHLLAARAGAFHESPALPLPFFVAVLALVALFGMRHPGGKLGWPAVVATTAGFIGAISGLAVTHVATAARLDDRCPADVLIAIPSDDEETAAGIAAAVASVGDAGLVGHVIEPGEAEDFRLTEKLAAAQAVAAESEHDEATFGPKRPTVLLVGSDDAVAAARLTASRVGFEARAIPISAGKADGNARWLAAAKRLWRSYLPRPAFMK